MEQTGKTGFPHNEHVNSINSAVIGERRAASGVRTNGRDTPESYSSTTNLAAKECRLSDIEQTSFQNVIAPKICSVYP